MSIGYFDDNKKEYVITDMRTERPLINYLWNEKTICILNQFGFGKTFSNIDSYHRDIDNGEKLVYIKDRETSKFYSANRNYKNEPFDTYKCIVGLGYHKIISEYNGVNVEFTITVPKTGYAELFSIKVKNVSTKIKKLSTYFYIKPTPNLTWHTSYGYGDYNKELNGLYYPHDGYDLPTKYTSLFLSASEKVKAFDVSDDNFKGIYNELSSPIGLENRTLSNKGTTFEDFFCGAMQFDFDLKASEEKEIYLCLGTAKNLEESINIGKVYASKEAFDKAIIEEKELNDSYVNTFICDTPDIYYNEMANIWLKRQVSLGKTWGRISGKGFRDVMQDITAFVSFDIPLARVRILDALKHQYEDGNPIRMYEPDFKYPYNDGASWIPAAILSYLKESGDFSILDEKLPYLKGDSYENSNMVEVFKGDVKQSEGKTDTVLNHIDLGMQYLINCTGERGLVLFRGGDWNDSLNNAGNKLKGESVWLSIATVKAINEYIEILSYIKDDKKIIYYKNRAEKLKQNIIKYGFDKDHFIYGYNDYNEKIGSYESEEAKIFLNTQTFAVLAGILSNSELEKVMNVVENNLKCDFGYKQCYPPFTKGTDRIGRVSYFMPGMVENASVYNHGVTFKIAADCMLKRGDNAYKSFKLISYDNPLNKNSGVEPYAVSNMYIGPDNKYKAGKAPMSWVTGSAGWLYRDLTEFILGIKPELNGLKIEPCLPKEWNNIKIKRILRKAVYNITIIRSDKEYIELNGKHIEGNILPFQQENTESEVKVFIK